MRILVDLILAPVGAIAFLALAVFLATGTIAVDPVGRVVGFLGFGFFGVLMAVGALMTIRRGVRRVIIEIGPDGAWTPDMGRLTWSEIAEVRLESMRAPSRGDMPTTTRYLRLGILPKDTALASRPALRLATGMTNAFLGLVRRIAPSVRLGPTDLAPYGVTDYELEDSIEQVVDAARKYVVVIDADERRARENAPRWAAAAVSGAATPPIVDADLRALDATLAPVVTKPAPAATPAAGEPMAAPAASPRATFRRPALQPLMVLADAVKGLSIVVIPIVFGFALTLIGNVPIWFLAVFLVIPTLFLVFSVRQLRATVGRLRRAFGDAETMAVGPDGVWLPELGRVPWSDVTEIRTQRGSSLIGSGGGSVELWRLVFAGRGREASVDADQLDAPFDDVIDLVRFYHPVVEMG